MKFVAVLLLVLLATLPLETHAGGSGNSSLGAILFLVVVMLIVIGAVKLKQRVISPELAMSLRPWFFALLICGALYAVAQFLTGLYVVSVISR